MSSTDSPGADDAAVVRPLGRVARKQQRNRDALVAAGLAVMSEKGVAAAKMTEIAERADVAAGTVYNYFRSKDELAVAVLEDLMRRLAIRIETVTDTFDDPAQVFAFGVRTVLDTAIGDRRWKELLSRSEVIADAIFRTMGPFAIRDLRNAAAVGRLDCDDPELVWRMATHAIVGVALAVTAGQVDGDVVEDAVVRLLGMAGMAPDPARELAARPRPALPPEE